MRAIHFVVSGRVQGVGYRMFVHRRAEALALAGWVRNLADGRVEGFAEGAPEQLDALVEALREGPPASRVTAVDLDQVDPERHVGFLIRR